MPELLRNKVIDDPCSDDWRVHRRWVLGMCGLYGCALLFAVTFAIVNQQRPSDEAEIAVRLTTQKRLAGSYSAAGSARQSAMNSALNRSEFETLKK